MKNWLLAATVIGLVTRIAVALSMSIPVTEDAADYQYLAVSVAGGLGYRSPQSEATALRPPGFPLFLAAVYRVLLDDPKAARLVLCVIGTAVIPLVGLLAEALCGAAAAKLAMLLAAVYPPFVSSWFSPRALLSEVLLTTLLVTPLALCVVIQRPGGHRLALALICGATCGYAILTKATVVFLPVVIAGYLLARQPALAQSVRMRLLPASLVVVGAVAVVLPWTIRNRMVLGAWVPVSTNGGISVWASYNPASRGLGNGDEGYSAAIAEDDVLRARGLDEVARSSHFFELVRAEVSARPRRAIRLLLRKTLLFWDPTLKDWSQISPPLNYNWTYATMLPLALLGMVAPTATKDRRLRILLGLTIGLFAGMHIVLHTDVRYRVPIEPLLIVFAAAAAVALTRRLGRPQVLVATGVWLIVNVWVAFHYEIVFSWLSTVVRGVGLG